MILCFVVHASYNLDDEQQECVNVDRAHRKLVEFAFSFLGRNLLFTSYNKEYGIPQNSTNQEVFDDDD